jgi:type I restriction enzyme M protein
MNNKTVLNKIFSDITDDLRLFANPEAIELYEKSPGKVYIKSLCKEQMERLVYSEENGIKKKSAPEEIVRQLYIHELTTRYKYPRELIEIEKWVNFGREKKRADIVVYRTDNITPKLLIEVKAPNEFNDVQQLKSYLNAEGAPVGVAINGKDKLILYRPYPKEFDDTLDDIPGADEEIEDVLQRRKTLNDLKEQDLKFIITNLEELVLANSGFDSFDEIFKLIYAKLFDEKEALNRPKQELWFRKSPTGNPEETKRLIDDLFEESKREWPDIFERTDKIKLSAEHLSVCVGELQDVRLFGSNLRIIDEAFEYLLPAVSKGKKGQYFTPRVVIDMCVKMLNPKNREYVIDPACGSAGFLVHAMQHVWKTLPTAEGRKEYATRYLFGIDFDEKSTKISRAIMLIAGDGKTHINKTNSLDTRDWPQSFKDELQKLGLVKEYDDYKETKLNEQSFEKLNFDILLANPPFAGEIKQDYLLTKYELGKNSKGKKQNKTSRHILFIERNLDLVKPGGRLAIVLPQGVFNNTSEEYIRHFIMKKARILAVVGLHGNSFKPHTGTKTSIIFLQKWHENQLDRSGNPTIDDYPIFFATSTQSFKDNSGNYIFERNEKGEPIKDDYGNPKYLSDLDEITEAFKLWGKDQNLDFLK